MIAKPGIEKHDKGPWVVDLQLGMEFIGFYVARNPRLDSFRDPSRGKYLRMQLLDRTGVIEARMWEGVDEIFGEINGGGPVKVAGTVENFRETHQINIWRLRPARDEEVDISDMIRTTEREVGVMWDSVFKAMEGIQDTHLAALVRYFFADSDLAARLKEAPSARRVHHSYHGGFLEHTYELLVLARPLLELYPEIDADLLISGILLHDIGKMEELSWGFDTDYTDEGRLLGHIILGEKLISHAIDTIDGFPRERALEVLHLVISHHGKLEWGSPRRPKTIEAVALHYLDNLDAQVNRFKLLIEEARANDQPWTAYDRMLRRSLYVGNGMNLSVEDNGIIE
jgi:3'-5' exoribonuclease